MIILLARKIIFVCKDLRKKLLCTPLFAGGYKVSCIQSVAGVLVGQPLDTIKVRLQTQSTRYRGISHCFSTIIKEETTYGLFKGMSAPLMGLSFINALVFGVQAQTSSALGPPTLTNHFLSGAIAGAVQSVLTSPMELAKTQMQVQGVGTRMAKDKVLYKNSIDVLVKLYRKSGVRGCYRGYLITLMRETPAFGCYFASFEFLTSHVFVVDKNNARSLDSILKWLAAGGFSGMMSWTITYPVDVVKSRLQADGAGGRPHKYDGMIDCAKQIYRTEGSKVFVRGLASTLLRAFPVNAATFAVVELCSHYFYADEDGDKM